jgi:hypothetical protein
MAQTKPGSTPGSLRTARLKISTRVAAEARDVIERVAAVRRTTPAQVARVVLEDAAKQLARETRAA